eukprot:12098880-Heterocapsa_arctica.AAC.1
MNKCECPTDGRQNRTIAESNEQPNKRVRKGPMDIVVEVYDEEGDLGRQHNGEQTTDCIETCYGKDVRKRARQKAEFDKKAKSEAKTKLRPRLNTKEESLKLNWKKLRSVL